VSPFMANYGRELRIGADIRRKGKGKYYGVLRLEYFS